MNTFKEKVYQTAITQVKEKINLLKAERKAINDGILEDTKSSAGDKFETGRETMSRDLMTVENQLKQANFEFDELCRFQAIKQPSATIQEGSLVKLGADTYLISISLGQITVDGEKLFMLSKNSPLGEILVGNKKNDQVEFRGKSILITELL
ncbi:hypothetical protein LV84_00489 [Algoriphagus ratkowskyi]|uniref:3-oxoacyl-ACP synthase n=1 Tax=Algoriphagus ratkowskyi TaxID=57028 RepID=A0A2W7RH25_9BACT|nr:hypothetical protein [Algoriphagus ratkowskyi]PZX60218.1 hypothetical protein LV84_00489 [Algoriphagus ratkowskyi]TXD78043.1 hypothetical protein ESW18_08315 [Algoriphagus ratkowskyi]